MRGNQTIVCALYRRGPLPLASMAEVVAKKRASFYFYDLDFRFLDKSIRITVFDLIPTEYAAESNVCTPIDSSHSLFHFGVI